MSSQESKTNFPGSIQETKRVFAEARMYDLIKFHTELRDKILESINNEVEASIIESQIQASVENEETLSSVGLTVILDKGSRFDEEPRNRDGAYVLKEGPKLVDFLKNFEPKNMKKIIGGIDMLELILNSLNDKRGSIYEEYDEDDETITNGLIELHRSAQDIIAQCKRLDPDKGDAYKAAEEFQEYLDAEKGGYKKEYQWMYYTQLLDNHYMHEELDPDYQNFPDLATYFDRLTTDLENIKIVLKHPDMKRVFGKRIKEKALEKLKNDTVYITKGINKDKGHIKLLDISKEENAAFRQQTEHFKEEILKLKV